MCREEHMTPTVNMSRLAGLLSSSEQAAETCRARTLTEGSKVPTRLCRVSRSTLDDGVLNKLTITIRDHSFAAIVVCSDATGDGVFLHGCI